MSKESIIVFKDCSIFQIDNLVLSNVSFNLNPGEFIYLIGKVGSGKTSLIKTINAQIPLRKGEAKVAGYNLTTLKKKQSACSRELLKES